MNRNPTGAYNILWDFDVLIDCQCQPKNDDFRLNCDMIFMNSGIQRPELKNKRALVIEGGDLSMNVCLFWRKDNNSPSIQKFKEALDFAEIK